MIVLNQTRRATRVAAERVRAALIELDELFQTYQVFQYPIDDQVAADAAYQVIKDDEGYVVALNDPSLV